MEVLGEGTKLEFMLLHPLNEPQGSLNQPTEESATGDHGTATLLLPVMVHVCWCELAVPEPNRVNT